MKKTNLSLVVVFLMLLSACSKDNDGSPDGGDNGYPSAVKGTIYYDWATEGILKVSLPEGVGSAFIPDDSKLNNFDVSRDGKYKLTVVNEQTVGKYPIRFTLSDISNGSIVEEFVYNSPGLDGYSKGYLSYDNSHILVLSQTKEDGITILKRDGEFVGRIHDINGEELGFNDQRLWLPGNALLIVHNNYIIRLDPPYTSGKLLKEMEYEDWGDVAVNPAGTQLAVRIANHVYTMDMDGSNLKQVTTSNFKEAVPEFSPDGKYLLVGTEYRQTGPFGWMWSLKIIPNDGKEYNVDPIAPNSPGVIPVFVKGKNKIETAGGQMIWR
ncbi:hypothetical protein FAZ15_14785 [Sphingobacterium olei]|uniref:WD40 repeat domain-containing protein n=1 Tax=Sphingobacterium olei TaxID=2571155 RepID=A0A4U0NK79_9SPHI|nr:hypothetical protein [Sphingobacterium olei]TJZ54745.1 hypothetical protein FAZ15_14785 [Sphingobacterium olei]